MSQMMGFQPVTKKFMIFLAVLMLVNLASTSMCMAISTITPSVAVGNLFAVILLLFFMMFGGFLVSNSDMPIYVIWARYASYFNYAIEALATNELYDLVIIFDPIGSVPLPMNGNEVCTLGSSS